jgi:alkyl hydroperoxide reductase subunit F
MDLPDFSIGLASLADAESPDPETTYDLLILGGSAAAMTAGVYAARKLMKAAILAKDVGGQMIDTSEIENYMGFQAISGGELTQKFEEQVKHFNVPIGLGEKVVEVNRENELFQVILESGIAYTAKTVIFATGKHPRCLDVPGEVELRGKGIAYCAICDAPFYRDKKVVVAGGSNSAFTAAFDLLKIAEDVTVVNYAKGWQADPIMQKSVRKHERVRLLDYHEITRIEGTEKVTAVRIRDRDSGKEETIPADGVFVEIGLIPNSDPVKGLVKLNDHGEVIVDCSCRTNVDGLFAAGDVTTVPFKQIVISAGEGAKAALSAYEYLTKRGML